MFNASKFILNEILKFMLLNITSKCVPTFHF